MQIPHVVGTRLLIVTLVVVLALAGAIRADVFVLKSGGRIEGQLVAEPVSGVVRYYVVKLDTGGTVKLTRAQVERIARKSDAEIQYEKILARLVDDVDSHWELAEWCRNNRLREQRTAHLEHVLRHDPGHVDARHGLGYSQVEGRWVRMDDWMESQGYVRHGTRWRVRQEVVLEEAADLREDVENKWRRDLKMWRHWIDRGRREQAMQSFNSINDPLAVAGLAQLLKEETSREMKLLFVEILGRLDTAEAKTPLIEAAIEDKSDRVRDDCLEQLEKQGRRQAVSYYLRILDPKKTNDDERIHYAGIALGRLGDQRAIRPLIDSLVIERKRVSQGSSRGMGIGASFGSGSPGGLSVGGKPKVQQRKVQIEGVLYGLKALTDQDFRYDQDAWREWYIKAYTPHDVSLRRGD